MAKGPFELMDEFGMDVVTRTLQPRGEPSHGVAEQELQWRLVLAMANEAARALSEGVTDSADDIDLATVHGLGFPPFRGGVAKFVEDEGVDLIVRRLDQLAARHGPRFAAADLLRVIARDHQSLPRPA
jgi:3-hydroxyacyl-CoA dehydrogenase